MTMTIYDQIVYKTPKIEPNHQSNNFIDQNKQTIFKKHLFDDQVFNIHKFRNKLDTNAIHSQNKWNCIESYTRSGDLKMKKSAIFHDRRKSNLLHFEDRAAE